MNDAKLIEETLIARLAASRRMTRDAVVLELYQTGGVIDSLEGIELVIEAERAFGICVSDKEISSDICRSVPALVAFVQSKRASSNEPQRS